MANENMKKNFDNKKDPEKFSEIMKKREKKKKEREKERRNPYNLLKIYLIILGAILFTLIFDTLLVQETELEQKTVDFWNHFNWYIYGTFLYILYIPISLLQDILSLINITLPFYLLLDINKDAFETYNFLTLNYNSFTENYHYIIDTKYVYLQNYTDNYIELNKAFFEFLLFALIKTLIFGYVTTYFIFKYLFFKIGNGKNEYKKIYEKYKKNEYGSGKSKKEIDKKKKEAKKYQKELLSKKGTMVDYINIYKDSFEARNAMMCAIFSNRIYKEEEKKYELITQINEIFDSYIPNKYYNIINFMTDVDKKIINVKAIEYEDTFTQEEYKEENLQKYLNQFNENNKKFIVPTFIVTLRKYRTFDTHNTIKSLFEYNKINIKEEYAIDQINKIKRLSKDAYKLYAKKGEKENQDAIGLSIQIRYPFEFSLEEIEKLELIREKTKIIISDMRLKFLSSDENMKLYSIEKNELVKSAKEYFDIDFENYINEIFIYTEEFFSIATKYYPFINTKEGEKYKKIVKQLIYLNFNPNYWMEEYSSLNSSHFKSLYFVENIINDNELEELKNILDDLEIEDIQETEINYKKTEDLLNEKLKFLKTKNMGFFIILKVATKYIGNIDDNNEIISFIDEFISFYENLTNELSKDI